MPINSTWKTQEIKLNSLIDLHNTSSKKNNVRSKLKGNTLFNSRNDIIISIQNK